MIFNMPRQRNAAATVLIVDDDEFQREKHIQALRDEGYSVIGASGVDSAIGAVRRNSIDVAILDVMLPRGRSFSERETHGGFKTGVVLARRLIELQPDIKILALTFSTDPEVQEWFSSDRESMAYLFKGDLTGARLTRSVRNLIDECKSPRVFIVHGRRSTALAELKKFLKSELQDPELIVLMEQSSKGRTVVEKFEHSALDVDLVFVLATGDDRGRLAKGGRKLLPRARQNVVFELGYFLGRLRRTSGKVILLYEHGIELPSDIAGVVYIDITRGIFEARTEILRELSDWSSKA